MYYIYMLRCEDNSIYTGLTTDLKRRMDEHFNKNDKCAKYTLNHSVEKLEIAWETETRVMASKLEYHIKQLSKSNKEYLIQNSNEMDRLLGNKVEYNNYKVIQGVMSKILRNK